jgi:uncharacterized protein YcgI (DUF1989 family)
MTRRIKAPVWEQHEDEFRAKNQAQARSQTHTEARLPPESQPPFQTLYDGFQQTPSLLYPPHVLSSLTLSTAKKTHKHIIPPKSGHAFLLKAHQSFRIIDLHGTQVVDLMAWTHPITPFAQYSSMSYTRYNIGGSAPPQIGESIYTNLGEEMLKLNVDTVKTHDLLYMACNPSFYAKMGMGGHENCAENISGAVCSSS